MSLRINTNVSAMNALRNVSQTNVEFSKSITRLSTGLRINSASDDPAGLIISQSFRAQIGGLGQAIKNSQDAINYSKTAEGALDEVHRLLNDARGLAVASANSATLTAAQAQANQDQLSSITSSITRIATTTQFGTKKLLDGSSGVTSSVTDGTNVMSVSIGGSFGNAALTANATVTVTDRTAATRALIQSATYATAGTSPAADGSFTINGTTFNYTVADTAQTIIDKVNAAQGQTGVRASYNTTDTKIDFESVGWGSNQRIDITDAAGEIVAAGTATDTGSDALATVSIGTTTGVLFTGSRNGSLDGLLVTDSEGNSIKLTEAGNETSATDLSAGQVRVGSASFQIGGNAGQTTSLALGNFGASNLGSGVVSGKNLANLDLTTASGATNALNVIDKAIEEVSKSRGNIGSFTRNVLESNIRALGTAKENLSATESSIRDVDVAEEMTNYTKQQILQQAGMSVLAQANQAPQAVLSLLRG